MFRRLFVVLLTLSVILAAGYFALRRGDIPYDTLEKAYSNTDSQFLKLADGTRLHFRDMGPRDAPAIILVHGFSASVHTWDDWTTDLESDFRVIAIDLPGHGLTRCLAEGEASVSQFVTVIDQITTQLGVDEFTMAGSSLGGNTAWAYALEHPEKVQSVVLIAASGWPKSEMDAETRPMVMQLLDYKIARMILKDVDMTHLIRSALEDSFVNESLVTDEMVQRYTTLMRAPCHRTAMLSLSRVKMNRIEATEETLAAITAPTLILHGNQDNLVPVSGAEKYHAAIPNTTLRTYEGVGHLPHEEIPERSLSDLRAFLKTHVYPEAEDSEPDDASPVRLTTDPDDWD